MAAPGYGGPSPCPPRPQVVDDPFSAIDGHGRHPLCRRLLLLLLQHCCCLQQPITQRSVTSHHAECMCEQIDIYIEILKLRT